MMLGTTSLRPTAAWMPEGRTIARRRLLAIMIATPIFATYLGGKEYHQGTGKGYEGRGGRRGRPPRPSATRFRSASWRGRSRSRLAHVCRRSARMRST